MKQIKIKASIELYSISVNFKTRETIVNLKLHPFGNVSSQNDMLLKIDRKKGDVDSPINRAIEHLYKALEEEAGVLIDQD